MQTQESESILKLNRTGRCGWGRAIPQLCVATCPSILEGKGKSETYFVGSPSATLRLEGTEKDRTLPGMLILSFKAQ